MIAQLSDPHLRASDPAAGPALAAAVRTVLGLATPVDAVLVSGDLTHDGDAASSAAVREALAPLTVPVHVIPGNHDDREALRTAFGLGGAAGEPLHVDARAGALRLLALDDHLPGADAGALGPAGLDWLAARLGDEPDVPTLIAMHHPAWPVGLPALDAIGLDADDAEALASIVAVHPQVVGLTAGHVHRAAATLFNHRPAVTAASVHTQARLDLGPEWTMVAEPPSLLVHVLVGDRLVTHVQPVLD